MALLLLEGFDKFGPENSQSSLVAGLLTAGAWTTTSGTLAIVAPLSATGQALTITGISSLISKTLAGNYSRLIGGMRFSSTLATGSGIQFLDGGSAQAMITIHATGLFSVRNGSAGTIHGTSTVSVSANTTHYLEWDITFANSGSYQLWLDGVSILSGSGDTTATTNAYANAFNVTSGNGQVLTVDDIYLFDTSGTTHNAVLLTTPRIETQFPAGDALAEFTPGAAVLGSSVARNANNQNPINGTANEFRVKRVVPGVNCTLTSVSLAAGNSTMATNTLRPIVYADSGGAPGSLLGTGGTAAGAAAGAIATLPLTSGVGLTAGTPYWIGMMISASGSGNIWSHVGGPDDSRGTATFASGAPSTAPSTSAVAAAYMYGTVTIAASAGNWWMTSQNPTQGSGASGLGDRSYVYEATVGKEDLYNYPALTVPPSVIHAVAIKASVAKSDTGARTVSLRLKTGSTDSSGSAGAMAPGTTFQWLASYYPTDPDTGAAWTPTALNAAQAGLKIDS